MENHSKKYICHLKQPYSFHHRKLRKTFHGMCWLVERGIGKLERKKTPRWYLWCSKWATKTFRHICWLMAGYAIQKWRNTLAWKSDVTKHSSCSEIYLEDATIPRSQGPIQRIEDHVQISMCHGEIKQQWYSLASPGPLDWNLISRLDLSTYAVTGETSSWELSEICRFKLNHYSTTSWMMISTQKCLLAHLSIHLSCTIYASRMMFPTKKCLLTHSTVLHNLCLGLQIVE